LPVLSIKFLSENPRLFDYAKLSQAHILEMECALQKLPLHSQRQSHLLRALRTGREQDSSHSRLALWCANKQQRTSPLVPLLWKNLLSRPSTATVTATVTALDWTLPTLCQIDVCANSLDVLLVMDCVYHPTLVRPLLATMTALAEPQHTVALVVAELRAGDVLREFLEGWIGLGWRVWSVGDGLLGARWRMWVAWREGKVTADRGV
jgi:Lysine methyltransferase